jgi:hypothetical protein
MELKRFFHTESGKVIISILLGLGLATLFKRSCEGGNCLSFTAPTMDDIKKKTYKYGENCFKYEVSSTVCDNNKKDVDFA